MSGEPAAREEETPWLKRTNRPSPVDKTRVYGPGGEFEAPLPDDQSRLESALPKSGSGVPRPFADPRALWLKLVNDGGPQISGRSNNCVDCSISFIATYHGEPTLSAARQSRLDGESDVRPARWLSTKYVDEGPGTESSTFEVIKNKLLDSGHGASASLWHEWLDGAGKSRGGHMWNAVNFNREVIWIDAQSGRYANEPLYKGSYKNVKVGNIRCAVIDREGRPA